jgi:serine/threonine protein kinase
MSAKNDQGISDSGVDVIGEGTFGCAHKPSMECRDAKRRNENEISKLMTTVNAIKELKEFALIDAADKRKQFYLGKPSECKPARILSNIRSIRKCPSGRFEPEKIDNYSLLVMKYGGQDLAQFGEEVQTWTKTREHVDAIELFWLEVVRLFYGLKVLHDNNVLHHDIKQQNIVYDQATNRVNLIDFGFMEKKSTRISTAKRSANWLGNKHHWSFPLEAVYWNKDIYMLAASARGKSKKAYREFAESVADNCGYFFTSVIHFNANKSKIDKVAVVGTKNAFRNVLEFEPTNESYDRFIEKSIDSVDTYGLGIALMFVLHRSKHLLSAEFYKNVMNIGVNMLEGRVFLRSTPEQLLAQYEDLLTNSGLLEKHNKHIENHLIANKVSREMKVAEAIADSGFVPPLAVTENIEIVRDCPVGKEFNPLSKRCVNVCATGKVRNPNFRCVKDRPLNERVCSDGKELNTRTRRCVKVCGSGLIRNPAFKCVKDKTIRVKDKLVKVKVCPGGKELNPLTRRCVKGCGSGSIRNSAFKCVNNAGKRKTRKNRIAISPIAVKRASSASMMLNIPAMADSAKWAKGLSDNWSKTGSK